MNIETRPTPSVHKYMIEEMMGPYLQELEPYREFSSGVPPSREYHYLKYYWSEAGRFPFTIWHAGTLAGFALVRRVNQRPQVRMSIAEFYIQPEMRRMGVGEASAYALWKRYPGQWTLQAIKANRPAVEFWKHTIRKYAVEWHVDEVRASDGQRLFFYFEIAE